MSPNSAQNGSILPAQAVEALTQTPEEYLKPSPSYNADWASLSKRYIDLLASSVSTTQSTRKNYVRKNRKRKHIDEEDEELQPLQIREIYLDGFTGRQVWEQVNKVLKASREEAGRDISLFNKDLEDAKEALRDEDGEQGEGQDDSEAEGDEEADEEEDFEGLSGGEDGEGQEEEEGFPEGEDDYVESEDEPEPSQLRSAKPKKAKADPHGLNDGFFSIDDFNAQSTMFERKDAKAEDDEDEDEEHIDWSADPNAQGGMEDLEDDEEDEDEEDEDVDMMGLGNANDIMYDDFFGPPDAVSKKGQDKGKRDEEPEEDQEMEDEEEEKEEAKPQERDEEEDQRDMERAMSDVRRDLFDDEPSDEEMSGAEGDGADSGPKSSHERQRVQIMDEIRRLEAANVQKKKWTLTGEAEAHDRPLNSLIEEDLDFERVGKPVPVISAEVSEDIELLIKRRIVAKEFDEVIRRRPGVATDKTDPRAGFVLEETKSQKSLGELYEADYQKLNDPNYVDPRTEKLKKEHAEIAALWKDLASQLDVLTSWHHRPAAPQANINVVKDTATIEMEEARPGVSSAISDARVLAPQEVYAPGQNGPENKGEVVLKSGAAVSKEEMSREEKNRRRRKEKRVRAKQFAQKNADVAAKKRAGGDEAKRIDKASEKKELLTDLKKGGVKVIDKGGKLTDVSGDKVAGNQDANTLRRLKL